MDQDDYLEQLHELASAAILRRNALETEARSMARDITEATKRVRAAEAVARHLDDLMMLIEEAEREKDSTSEEPLRDRRPVSPADRMSMSSETVHTESGVTRRARVARVKKDDSGAERELSTNAPRPGSMSS